MPFVVSLTEDFYNNLNKNYKFIIHVHFLANIIVNSNNFVAW